MYTADNVGDGGYNGRAYVVRERDVIAAEVRSFTLSISTNRFGPPLGCAASSYGC